MRSHINVEYLTFIKSFCNSSTSGNRKKIRSIQWLEQYAADTVKRQQVQILCTETGVTPGIAWADRPKFFSTCTP